VYGEARSEVGRGSRGREESVIRMVGGEVKRKVGDN